MELLRALGAILDPPAPERRAVEAALGLRGGCDPAEHTELFTFQLTPYASVYVGAEGMLGGEARDRVAGFWRALALTPPPEPDHLALLLSLHAALSDAAARQSDPARRGVLERSCGALLWEHLASWVPVWLLRVDELAGPFHRAWGRLLLEAMTAAVERTEPLTGLPLHLRAAPPPLEAGGEEDLLGCLLAPVRSGVILTRADLARAGRTLGLGLRAGERRFTLAALLAQDPQPTLRWLTAEAERQAESVRRLPHCLGPIPGFWSDRARSTARALASMATCEPAGASG